MYAQLSLLVNGTGWICEAKNCPALLPPAPALFPPNFLRENTKQPPALRGDEGRTAAAAPALLGAGPPWGTVPPFRGPSSARQARKARRGGLGRAVPVSWARHGAKARGSRQETRPGLEAQTLPTPISVSMTTGPAPTRAIAPRARAGLSGRGGGKGPLSPASSGAARRSARPLELWAAVGGRLRHGQRWGHR